MCEQNLEFVALPIPEIIAIGVLGGGCKGGGLRGSRMVQFERAFVSSCRHSIVTFPENFRESLATPTAILFPKLLGPLMGFCCDRSY